MTNYKKPTRKCCIMVAASLPLGWLVLQVVTPDCSSFMSSIPKEEKVLKEEHTWAHVEDRTLLYCG